MAAAAATAKAAEEMVSVLDEETLALMGISSSATEAPVAVAAELEAFKENVRPLKRGRDVSKLNHALKAHADPAQRAALLESRKKMIEAIYEYQGEDPLQPWLDCIKWVQESFPTGGECSGLVVLYEQCVRTLWHDERYKEDLRFLKVWLEYAGNCADAEVIYRFLEANQIGQGHAIFYMAYASLMETKNKLRNANDIFNLGIARKAKPLEKLEALYRTFLRRSTKRMEHEQDDTADDLPKRSFGTNLKRDENRNHQAGNSMAGNQQAGNSQLGRPRPLQRIDTNRPLSVYKDERPRPNQGLDRVKSKENNTSWRTLGTQSERNKENSMMPAKWTSHKIPQKLGAVQSTRASTIEVFVEEDCTQEPARPVPKNPNSSGLKLRQATSKSLKKETELLKENPLRNFPLSSLR